MNQISCQRRQVVVSEATSGFLHLGLMNPRQIEHGATSFTFRATDPKDPERVTSTCRPYRTENRRKERGIDRQEADISKGLCVIKHINKSLLQVRQAPLCHRYTLYPALSLLPGYDFLKWHCLRHSQVCLASSPIAHTKAIPHRSRSLELPRPEGHLLL